MEALYLLASLATTLLASTFLSLLLLLRLLLLRFTRCPLAGGGDGGGVSTAAAVRLYEGRVRHSRRRPAAHAFKYPVRYALVDLDRLPLPGHLSPADARRVASTSGPVYLLTIPKSVGICLAIGVFVLNPLGIVSMWLFQFSIQHSATISPQHCTPS